MLTERREPKVKVHIEDLKDEYLDCRDLRHSWQRSSRHDLLITRNASKKVIEFTRVITCSRCGTERHTTLSVPNMAIARSRYVYPVGYLLLGSKTDPSMKVDASGVRREVFSRVYASLVK